MNTKKTIQWDGCPVRFAAGIFGDKWAMLIIRDLLFKGKRYYGEFTDEDEAISTNILADRLKKLEENQIITKKRDPDNQAKFIYSLTTKGLSLLPIMLDIIDWSEKFDPNTEVPQAFIQPLRENRTAFEEELRLQLEKDMGI